ncbi:unnamed protein product, partial [Rotaria sp. Silwood2]
FNSNADRNSIPSAIHASDLIFKELELNGVLINRFSLVGWNGRKLKLGVNNKVDYSTLANTAKWPTKINGIDIVVVKPTYTPDSFALVARYVPRELEENFVEKEIQRTIASADQIKRIHFAYHRKTDDYRFYVKDYNEYNAVLQLGRIAIGHSWLSVTKFYPDIRFTYCTKCWCIGYLRNTCSSTNKCRICLEKINVNDPHICKKEPKCAQCGGSHHSVDSQCQAIQEDKIKLKEDVEDAINKDEWWYSGNTLNSLLHLWENNEKVPCQKQKEYIKILCYNVEGWGIRALEAVDLVYKTQASICIFTEVGELWNMSRLPHFNTFYQKGTNKNGGVCIAVGKYLKATRVEVNIPNTVVVDITGLSEPVRIIGIYWPASQQRDLNDILSYVIEGTILSGDFNATVKEWNSP